MNWRNYDDVLRQLQAFGLLVDSIGVEDVGTARPRRVRTEGDREKRGWYQLHELRLDGGDTLLVGSFGVWHGNVSNAQRVQITRGTVLSDAQRDAIKARIAADRRAADITRKAEGDRAAARAAAMWARLGHTGSSEYLTRKAVQAYGVRFAPSGAVLIPLLDLAGTIHGLQAIYPKGHLRAKRLGRDKDFWPAGVVKQGHMFLLGSPGSASVCLIAEGYATAASLHEAMGIPVAVAFDAGNLLPVAVALRKRWPQLRLLVCADDDHVGRCHACGKHTLVAEPECAHCGEPHGAGNAGVLGADAAALAVGGAWVVPHFDEARPTDRKGGPTDFNDLHQAAGLHAVRAQVEARLTDLDWRAPPQPPRADAQQGEGEDAAAVDLTSVTAAAALMDRFALVYEAKDTVFDFQERCMVPLASMRNLCTAREIHRAWMESAEKRIVRLGEVGFDPGESDPNIKCNMWSGWPTRAKAGRCEKLLQLGEYLCSLDPRAGELWMWLQRWLAYPLQHPGAKMKTAVIMHGPQGTGKNVFFEAVLGIYGQYGQVVDQDAVEDKHNDYMSRKLMLVADEVVAKMEMFTTKNKLKVLVTSDWLTINPKFVARYRERNHVNLVFLSNEVMPMALERDDRRYTVIWTPPRLDQDFYNAVLAEISAGGVAALHDYLLHLDLGGFGPATLPPMTAAKADLIEMGLDSSERMYTEWTKGHLPLPATVARTEDLYDAYRHWCHRHGVMKPVQMSTFVGNVSKRPGVTRDRVRHYKNHSQTVVTQSTVLYPPGADRQASMADLAEAFNAFNAALRDWRREAGGSSGRNGSTMDDGGAF